MATIVFNGKTYGSIDDMPVNERRAFEQLSSMFVDRDGNGIPDFLEGDMAKNVMTAFSSTVHYNGRTYNSMDDLPPDIRLKVQGAFQELTDMGIVDSNTPLFAQVQGVTLGEGHPASTRPLIPHGYSPAISEEKTSNTLIWYLGVIGIIVCLVLTGLGVFYFLR